MQIHASITIDPTNMHIKVIIIWGTFSFLGSVVFWFVDLIPFNYMLSQKFLVMTVCFLPLIMNVFDDVTILNPVNLQTDALKLTGKLTVNKFDNFKKGPLSKTVLSFSSQLIILRSGDVELNPGPLTIYKYLIQYFTEKSTHLKLFHMNCQSLVRKHALQHMMKDLGDNTNFAFSQTWLNENDDEKVWRLNKKLFKTFRCDCKSNEKQQGGGIMIIIAPKYLTPKLRKGMNKLNPNHCESLWIECNLNMTNSTRRNT